MTDKEYIYDEHLRELHASEYEMANGEPDIRNWKVVAVRNQEIGRIKELLFDETTRRVKYLVVSLYGKPLNLLSREVIVPIGLAELNKRDKLVFFRDITVGHLALLPGYEKGKLTTETEREIHSVFAPSPGIRYGEDDLIKREVLEERTAAGEDRVIRPTGEVVQKDSLKNEIKNNIERVKESVRQMESDVEKLGRKEA
jgi:hypothetical protein